MSFVKKITEWLLEKEEELAKKCAVPMEEIEYQIAKVQAQKEKITKEYEEAMAELESVEKRLQKIKNLETLRCQNQAKES
jgi:DNA repair ATPase RecN